MTPLECAEGEQNVSTCQIDDLFLCDLASIIARLLGLHNHRSIEFNFHMKVMCEEYPFSYAIH